MIINYPNGESMVVCDSVGCLRPADVPMYDGSKKYVYCRPCFHRINVEAGRSVMPKPSAFLQGVAIGSIVVFVTWTAVTLIMWSLRN